MKGWNLMDVKMLRTLADRYTEAINERRQIGQRLQATNAELSDLHRQKTDLYGLRSQPCTIC